MLSFCESYGVGNAPVTDKAFMDTIKAAVKEGGCGSEYYPVPNRRRPYVVL